MNKIYLVFSRGTGKYNFSERWSYQRTFDERKYAEMYIEVETQDKYRSAPTVYHIAEVEIPVANKLPQEEVSA